MLLNLFSQAEGKTTPSVAPRNEAVKNGDFNITTPDGANASAKTGDGLDESTAWNFDFKRDVNWANLLSEKAYLKSAILTLTLTPKHSLVSTDWVKINRKDFAIIGADSIRELKPNQTGTITVNLIAEGYNPQNIFQFMKENNGLIPMLYTDDAVVSFARLDLIFEVKCCLTLSC